MHALGASARNPAAISIVGAIGLLSFTVATGRESSASALALFVVVVTVVALGHRAVLGWERLIALVLLVVLFVPIGRYSLPGSLPFDFELYRLVVAGALLLWLTALLIDPRVRLVRTPFDFPVLLIIAWIAASDVTNPDRVGEYGSYVAKSITFFLSFVLFYYLLATTIRSRQSIEFLLKLLTLGGAGIGIVSVYERRAGYNVFDHLHNVLPFLSFEGSIRPERSLRSIGPSETPVSLAAAMIIILPFAIYFARTSGRRWWFAAFALVLGALSSISRTMMVMVAAQAIVFLYLNPTEIRKELKKLWPFLIPAVVLVHALLPGAMGSLKNSLFPKGGIIAQQSRCEIECDPMLAGGRIRVLMPTLAEASERPIFGHGFGTRVTGFNSPERNAPILDNQWLASAVEIGFGGVLLWFWLFVSAGRTLMRASRRTDRPDDELLFGALAASLASVAVAMLTFDLFGFTQVFFIFWIVLGVSAALLSATAVWPHGAAASTSTRIKSALPASGAS